MNNKMSSEAQVEGTGEIFSPGDGKIRPEGLYRTKVSGRWEYTYCDGGVLYLPTSWLSTISVVTSGHPLVVVDNMTFMRAAHVIDIVPSERESIEEAARVRGLTV